MTPLRFAILGAGFWSHCQLSAWQELEGVECVAIYNRTRHKAEQLASSHNIAAAIYDDVDQMFKDFPDLDFVDIITDVDTHVPFAKCAAELGIPVICQKPLAPTLELAEELVSFCQDRQVPLLVHENWRWQCTLRAVRDTLDQGAIGKPFRGRIQYSNSFPVFRDQPFLKELDQFILTDIGTHILDVARFLFGEASSLFCITHRVHSDIKGEDVATVMMEMDGISVVCEMSYASRMEHDRFPETFVLIEGERGSLELGPDYWLRITTDQGTIARRIVPHSYAWTAPTHALIHQSIVPCHKNLVTAIRHSKLGNSSNSAETTGTDNLQTLRLVYGAYESATKHRSITF